MDSSDSLPTSDGHPADRTWFEDGILFEEYHFISLARILAMAQRGVELVSQHKQTTVPVVITLKDEARHNTMNMTDYGKVANTPMTDRTAAIYIVGVPPGPNRNLAGIASRIFFGNKIRFFDTFKQAREAGLEFNKQRQSDGFSVLDDRLHQ